MVSDKLAKNQEIHPLRQWAISIPHNLAYKTRILWGGGGRSDRGTFEPILIGRIVLWQSKHIL